MIYTLGQIAMIGLVAWIGLILLVVAVLLYVVIQQLRASAPAAKVPPLFSRGTAAPKEKIKPVSVSDQELWEREQEAK